MQAQIQMNCFESAFIKNAYKLLEKWTIGTLEYLEQVYSSLGVIYNVLNKPKLAKSLDETETEIFVHKKWNTKKHI